jgi:hydroxymethyl cephem carbamoyltransferase
MLILGVNPGHDGGVVVVEDRQLLYSLESEKDSFGRHAKVTPMCMLNAIERLDAVPDVIALSGYTKEDTQLGEMDIWAGYFGAQAVDEREATLFGAPVKLFSSSHIRSHILTAAGLAPPDEAPQRAVLVWEGAEGSFFLLDEQWNVIHGAEAMKLPGHRYAMLFDLADPSYPDSLWMPQGDDAGKLMALAAYGDAAAADEHVVDLVDRLVQPAVEAPKSAFKNSPLYNAGVESEAVKTAAALLTRRMFDKFAHTAQAELPAGIPLYIAGGCGLNCDWNTMWRDLGYFSSVFVPPCPNDSGSAVGTACDALLAETGDPRVEWNVYCGLEFEWDTEPSSEQWRRQPLRYDALSEALLAGRVVAWVQGRWEMGPRALGNRSLLAEPSRPETRDRLNEIKLREDYRPIAPCCRVEDLADVFDRDFEDPYMLYFRMVTSGEHGAVTHVDGSARCQTVSSETNPPLHELLTAFRERYGVGLLCNTSLNFKGYGFMNRMSDLVSYCERRGVDDMVVGDTWFERIPARGRAERRPQVVIG